MFLAIFMKRDQVIYALKVMQPKAPNITRLYLLVNADMAARATLCFNYEGGNPLRRERERERVDFAASCLFSVQLLPPSFPLLENF